MLTEVTPLPHAAEPGGAGQGRAAWSLCSAPGSGEEVGLSPAAGMWRGLGRSCHSAWILKTLGGQTELLAQVGWAGVGRARNSRESIRQGSQGCRFHQR